MKSLSALKPICFLVLSLSLPTCLIVLTSGCTSVSSNSKSKPQSEFLNSLDNHLKEGYVVTGIVKSVEQSLEGRYNEIKIVFDNDIKLIVYRGDGKLLKWKECEQYTCRWESNKKLLVFEPTSEYVKFQYEILNSNSNQTPVSEVKQPTLAPEISETSIQEPIPDPLPSLENIDKILESSMPVDELINSVKKQAEQEQSMKVLFYAIYDHPTDFPDHFVVRKWSVSGDVKKPEIQALEIIGKADSLEEARNLIPENHQNIGRFFGEDQKIVESWIAK